MSANLRTKNQGWRWHQWATSSCNKNDIQHDSKTVLKLLTLAEAQVTHKFTTI